MTRGDRSWFPSRADQSPKWESFSALELPPLRRRNGPRAAYSIQSLQDATPRRTAPGDLGPS